MKIGIMGGTFDPIHIGHLLLGEFAYEEFGLDEIWYLPNGNPPHKQQTEEKEALRHRVEMIRLSIREVLYFKLCLHEAKEQGLPYVTCWGDGSPLREFLYVDDLANLCVFLMNHYSGNETVNAGTGKELTIKELTELVAKVIGYTGEIRWDAGKPNGTPRKLLDVSKATALGWTYRTELEEGIRLSYEDFLSNPMRAER